MTNLPPIDDTVTLHALDQDPFPIYRRLRAEAPVVRIKAAGRTFLTKAADTKYVKDNPVLFSSNDPKTPMTRAFRAHTLMRKDGEDHKSERMAMAPAFAPKVIMNDWIPRYEEVAKDYVARLPKGEVVDLFAALSAPYNARGLAILLGIEDATDAQIERWSQTLIDGAGNFGLNEDLFARSDAANDEMDALFDSLQARHKVDGGNSAFAVMLNADNPIAQSQIYANIKIAIGGGVNEPRDALNTILFGLLTNPDQLAEVKRNSDWDKAFEEGVRWIAPISASGRVATQDTEVGGYLIEKGDTVMTIQASANRDEDVVQNGEIFDVYRDRVPNQSFGNGPHFCMGTHVARRAVAQVMLPILFDRFPNMTIPDPDAVIWRGFGFHGATNLPVLLN